MSILLAAALLITLASDGPSVPVALAWTADGRLHVAARDAREIASIDPTSWKIVGRDPLPFRPAALAASDDGSTLYVGGMDGEVAALGSRGLVMLSAATGKGPARVLALPSGRVLASSTWDPTIRVLDGSTGAVARSIPTPFPPGAMVRRSGGRVIVADAFADRLADLDPKTGKVRARSIDGVGLRALGISGDGKELLIGHIAQYGAVPLTGTNLDWGLVLSSRLSAVKLSEFDGDGRDGDLVARRRLTLDGSGHGAADPASLAVSPDGTLVFVALAGAHQVLKNDRTLDQKSSNGDLLPLGNYQRLELREVGRSPLDLTIDPSGECVVTADAMSDTLSVLRVDNLEAVAIINLGDPAHPPLKTAAQRGEAHFLDGRRSLDRWMSCSSCHPSGHTTGLNFDTLGDGGYGAAKNTTSLLGVANTSPFGWVGGFKGLEEQVHQSMRSSLRGPSPDPSVIADVVAYLGELSPPPPRRPGDGPAALRGARVFDARKCGACHQAPLFTTPELKYVALDDGPGGHKAFNPPSLRGVGWSAPYLHDGRASTLRQVLEIHPPTRSGSLSEQDLMDLIAYLESL